jgi:Ankyrin repeats (many copies)
MVRKPKLRKTLPKELAEQMTRAAETSDYSAVHAALEACEVDARGSYCKGTLLMMGECTPELARWAVARGLDVNAGDTYGRTALHESARSRYHHKLGPAVLIELGANVNLADEGGLTPLHSAADGKNLAAVTVLLSRGSEVNAAEESGLTPLEYGLRRVSNADLVDMLTVVEALRAAGAKAGRAPEFVKEAAERFEFHRAGFAKESVVETSAASRTLCEMFGVTPPSPRMMHDGKANIVARAATWQTRHSELWDLLVPSSGACKTMQGEVIRIAGRIGDELHRNGGCNWDGDYDAMIRAFCDHVASHIALATNELAECTAMIRQRSRISTEKGEGTARLAELAVKWVSLNPMPIALPTPAYTR